MSRARNIVFTAIIAAVLLSVLGNIAAAGILGNYDIPERSYLEGRAYQQVPDLSLETVASGDFQTEAEQFVADRVPLRDSLLLGNASIQAASISASNVFYGFSAYHTFYGSDTLYVPRDKALTQQPEEQDGKRAKALKSFSKGLASVAKEHPDVKFAVIVADRSSTSMANPAMELVSGPWYTSNATDNLASHVKNLENVSVICVDYDDAESFYDNYFATDHHWTLQGACAAYNQAAIFLEKPSVNPSDKKEVSDIGFYGSNARNGLYPLSDDVCDLPTDFSDITLKFSSGKTSAGDDRSAWWELDESQRRYVDYGTYFGEGSSRNATITSENGEGTALVICDSFGDSFRLIIGKQYAKTQVYDHLHWQKKNDSSNLNRLINKTGAKTVIFVAWANDYQSFTKRMPNYFAL